MIDGEWSDDKNDNSDKVNIADTKVWQRELPILSKRIIAAADELVSEFDATSDNYINVIQDNDGPDNSKDLIVFCKHMAKFASVYDFDNETTAPATTDNNKNYVLVHRHLFLIRDPVAVRYYRVGVYQKVFMEVLQHLMKLVLYHCCQYIRLYKVDVEMLAIITMQLLY